MPNEVCWSGWPGGFPWMGVKVLLGSDEIDSTKWDCNNLSSMFGNWGFLFAEVLMHLIMFPIRLQTFYNAGLVTTIGLGAIGCCYFFGDAFDAGMFHWYDYVLAVVWFGANFLFFFRSKLYWNLGKKPGYELTEQSAFGAGFRKS